MQTDNILVTGCHLSIRSWIEARWIRRLGTTSLTEHSPAFEEAILPMELPNWHTRRALLASALGRMRALVFPV
jgi:hypothetical protein